MTHETLVTRKSRGFTLAEMLAVIAIISILTSVVIVSFNPARTTARINSAVGMMESTRATGVVCVSRRSNLNAPSAGTLVCANTDLKWPTLPAGWSYGGGTCVVFEGNVSDGAFTYCATGDSTKITCTQTECTKS